MTIAFKGHVKSISSGPIGFTTVVLCGDSMFMGVASLNLTVPTSIAQAYFPGNAVQFTIHPLTFTSQPAGQEEKS